ncbi:hypothetical protein HLI03_31585 [Rhizobium laguerreae]|uniref:hypothetical protein n=1 Tax=Rhizobium laguerreae TaxID=1076926 RepID=UPI001478D6FF|nr:hypothetical protein [Rhizobium laguerreae]NNH46140.1 hypothetical protein [Rhizobium laguerreae]
MHAGVDNAKIVQMLLPTISMQVEIELGTGFFCTDKSRINIPGKLIGIHLIKHDTRSVLFV